MSIVRYTNKKTGKVAVYESTSNYDPERKQSRPKRKYLGMEDPETGKIIPSSGKRGRKKSDGDNNNGASKANAGKDYKQLYETLLRDCAEKDSRIKSLEDERQHLLNKLGKIQKDLDSLISSME